MTFDQGPEGSESEPFIHASIHSTNIEHVSDTEDTAENKRDIPLWATGLSLHSRHLVCSTSGLKIELFWKEGKEGVELLFTF